MKKRSAIGGLLMLANSVPAFAAAPDAVQAQALEQQIAQSLSSVFGPQNRPVQLTPAGDHYLMQIQMAPFYERFGAHITGLGALSGTLAPLDRGRWSVDNLAVPTPTHFSFDPALPKSPGPVTVDLTVHELISHSVIDLAFATPWTGTSSANGYDMTMAGHDLNQVVHTGPFASHGTLTPAADGRLDLVQDLDLRGYSSESKVADGTLIHTDIGHIAGSLHLAKIDPARLAEAFTLVQAAKAKQADGQKLPQAEMNALLHSVILALRAAVSGGGVSQTVDGIAFQAAAMSFKLQHFETAIEADAPAGLLGARMRLTFDGPSSPMIPPTALPYVPSHLVLQPYVSGIGVAELTQLALDATAPDPQQNADPSALFAKGALVAGIDHLELLVGQTALTGTGQIQAPSPAAITGHAKVTASHFDALMQIVQKDKVLGPRAMPVLILARGLAKPEGDNLVWEIAYDSGAISVNGTDLSSLAGGMK